MTMARTAEETAQSAEGSHSNSPGYCLQWSRERAGIAALYPDAATAWRNATGKRPGDRNPPRGAPVYWEGGSQGYGHIAICVGNGQVRSTDAGGAGNVATKPIGWFESNWGLPFAGWADSINGVTIPGLSGDEEMELSDEISNWSPDDGEQGKVTVGKSLNQARGYSEDTYQRMVQLQAQVDGLAKQVSQILNAVT